MHTILVLASESGKVYMRFINDDEFLLFFLKKLILLKKEIKVIKYLSSLIKIFLSHCTHFLKILI